MHVIEQHDRKACKHAGEEFRKGQAEIIGKKVHEVYAEDDLNECMGKVRAGAELNEVKVHEGFVEAELNERNVHGKDVMNIMSEKKALEIENPLPKQHEKKCNKKELADERKKDNLNASEKELADDCKKEDCKQNEKALALTCSACARKADGACITCIKNRIKARRESG